MVRIKRVGRSAPIALGLGLLLLQSKAFAQTPTAEALPSSAIPSNPASDPAMEERIRKLEADNRQILELCKSLTKQNEDLAKRLESAYPKDASVGNAPPTATATGGERTGGGSGGRASDASGRGGEGASGGRRDASAGGMSQRNVRGVGAQGTEGRTFLPESVSRGSDKPDKRKAIVEFGEGLEFSSDDDEFKIQFHDLTQAELRLFSPLAPNGLLRDQFFIPRQRWYFTGHVTKNVEFYTVINRGYGSLDLLDAFLTLRYDPRLRFRIGRMKTPYLYEYYQIAEGDLIAPERSIYAGNFAGNRQEGAMFLGELFQNRMGYSFGVFNGSRRSFGDTNNAKDLFVFLNTRPFLKPTDEGGVRGAEGTGGRTRPTQNFLSEGGGSAEPGPLEYLNLGGSFNIGYEQNSLQPAIITTANDETTITNNAVVESLSPTFFAFNNNAVEHGMRAQWSAHAVWYYKSLMVLAEYGGGYAGYSTVNSPASVRVPIQGFTIGPSYFLTGERLTRRVNVVKPRNDLRVRKGGITGTGAVEVFARYSYFDIGKNVFTAGFADPNQWTSQASTVDVGANWYLNFYTKIYLDWQHAMFGSPVATAPGTFSRAQDVVWLRFQLFF